MKPIEPEHPGELPEGFLELPAQVYGDDPQWIPEDPASVQRAFSENNAWFLGGREALPLAVPGLARLAVFFDPATRIDERKVAFFGYFESVGRASPKSAEAEAALFARARDWARERGAEELYGPINFTTFGNYRLRLSAEPGAGSFLDEPHNPPDYPVRLGRHGFELVQRYVTQLGTRETMRALADGFRPALERNLADGYRFEALTPEIWLSHLDQLHTMIDAMFGQNFAYTPIGLPAFRIACGPQFIRRACPTSSIVVYAPDASIAGFCINYPDYGPLVVQGARERVAAAALDYAEHAALLPADRGVILKTCAVHPAHRRRGLMEAIGASFIAAQLPHYSRYLGALIRANNRSREPGQGVGTPEREYGLYRQAL